MSLKFKKFNNKGIVLDVLTLFVSVIAVVITLIIAGTVWVSFQSAFHETTANMSQEYSQEINDSMGYTDDAFRTIDVLFFPIAIVGLIIGLIITSFLIPSHPIFVVVNIVGLIFLVFMSLVMQVIYEQIVAVPDLSTGLSFLTVMPYVMEFLPWIGAVAVLVATIIGYSKRGEGAY